MISNCGWCTYTISECICYCIILLCTWILSNRNLNVGVWVWELVLFSVISKMKLPNACTQKRVQTIRINFKIHTINSRIRVFTDTKQLVFCCVSTKFNNKMYTSIHTLTHSRTFARCNTAMFNYTRIVRYQKQDSKTVVCFIW